MVLELGQPAAELFLIGRLLFAGTLLWMASKHFWQLEFIAGYAEYKGVPYPTYMTALSGLLLMAGSTGIMFGVYPVLSAGGVLFFMAVVTPWIHDFWAAQEENKADETNQFLKNLIITGATVAFLGLGFVSWPYAANIGLFI